MYKIRFSVNSYFGVFSSLELAENVLLNIVVLQYVVFSIVFVRFSTWSDIFIPFQ